MGRKCAVRGCGGEGLFFYAKVEDGVFKRGYICGDHASEAIDRMHSVPRAIAPVYGLNPSTGEFVEGLMIKLHD